MKKDRDWLDYANTAANAGQLAELEAIRRTLKDQAKKTERVSRVIERVSAIREREDELREKVFQLHNVTENLVAVLETNPFVALVLATELKEHLKTQGITSGDFHSYEDKDRFKETLNDLDNVFSQCAVTLQPSQMDDVKKCIQLRTDLSLANRFLAKVPHIHECRTTIPSELERAERERAEIIIPGWYSVMEQSILIVIGCVPIFLLSYRMLHAGDSSISSISAGEYFSGFLITVSVYVLLSVLFKAVRPASVKRKIDLEKYILGLKAAITNFEAEWNCHGWKWIREMEKDLGVGLTVAEYEKKFEGKKEYVVSTMKVDCPRIG